MTFAHVVCMVWTVTPELTEVVVQRILGVSESQSNECWKAWKWSESCPAVSNSLWPHGLYSPWSSPGQNTGVGSLSLLQGIFPTQGSNPGLPHCRQILHLLSHKGSPWPSWVYKKSYPKNNADTVSEINNQETDRDVVPQPWLRYTCNPQISL